MGATGAAACEMPPSAATAAQTLDALLRFGALALCSGDTAFRVRRLMTQAARSLGFDALSVQFGIGSLSASAWRGSGATTLVQQVGPQGVDIGRIVALERLAQTLPPAASPAALASGVAAIGRLPPRHGTLGTAAAIGVACGAFAFLNGSTGPEMAACALSGAVGQALRSWLQRRRFNAFATALVCALVAAGTYGLISAMAARTGVGPVRNGVGLISTVLFLVPGYPLLASLLDVLQNEAGVALTRLVDTVTLLLYTALGLGVVITIVGFAGQTVPAPPLAEPLRIALRALASLAGACGFAILYQSAWRDVLLVGLIAILGNEIRLALHDAGMPLPAATFFGALAVGLAVTVLRRRLDEAQAMLAIPGVIMMIPGLYAFETVVNFEQGNFLAGIETAVLAGVVVGAMAMGLATASFVRRPAWLRA